MRFFCFRPKIPFLSKFGKRHQNCQFKLKVGTYTNLNIQNSMVVFIFICFRLEIFLLDKLAPENQNCQFKLKLGTYANSNIQKSMALFTFSVFDQKRPFRANWSFTKCLRLTLVFMGNSTLQERSNFCFSRVLIFYFGRKTGH